MNKEQILRALKVLIIMTVFLYVLECIFLIPGVTEFFTNWFNGANGWTLYLIVAILMFLQGTILNIPAVTILELSILAGINTLSILYISVVMIAYMLACIVSYWLGRKFGVKAVKWIAGDEQEFGKWSNYINKKGKWWYLITVLLPIFPDDLLCIVAGSVKLNFVFYTLANLIGRTIGLVTMLLTLKFVGHIGGDFPIMLIVWLVGLVIELIAYGIIKNKR